MWNDKTYPNHNENDMNTMRKSHRSLLIAPALGLALIAFPASGADDKVAVIEPEHRAVVATDAGLWPNLVTLPKGR